MNKSQELTVKDIKTYLESVTKGFHRDEGLHFGNPDTSVNKILVCWMADLAAITYAAEIGADLIITHESLFYPYDIVVNGNVPEFMTWRTNQRRIDALAKNGISVIRVHGGLDKLCIFDDFAAKLQLGEPVISESDYVKIYEIKPIDYGDLITRVKSAVGMEHVRATNGDRNRKVQRIGLPWGGMALFVNVGYMQSLVQHNCDVFIAGETDNYGFRFAIDAGIDMIETSHEISENPGLKHFTELLANTFPNVSIEFYENEAPWSFS